MAYKKIQKPILTGVSDFDADNIIGVIRLWEDETKTPTDKYIVFTSMPNDKGQTVGVSDSILIDLIVNKLFTDRRLNIDNFTPNHTFQADLFITRSILDKYTG